MAHTNNYQLQAQQAKRRFLTYDQEKLIAKFGLSADADYLYPRLLSQNYRLRRSDGFLEKQAGDVWLDANTHAEVMTLLDLLCDSREDRQLSGRYKSMSAFGLMFHQNLLEEKQDSTAAWFDAHPEQLHAACRALGGSPFPGCDIGYAVELFDGLSIALQFWHGDEEFLPRLRFLWDENALQYIRYETMYFAINLLRSRLVALQGNETVLQ